MELQAKDKLRAPLIVMTGGERPVDEAEIARTKANELARTGNDFDLSGKSVTTEFDLLRETAALKLGITDDEWQNFSGDDPTVPHGQLHSRDPFDYQVNARSPRSTCENLASQSKKNLAAEVLFLATYKLLVHATHTATSRHSWSLWLWNVHHQRTHRCRG